MGLNNLVLFLVILAAVCWTVWILWFKWLLITLVAYTTASWYLSRECNAHGCWIPEAEPMDILRSVAPLDHRYTFTVVERRPPHRPLSGVTVRDAAPYHQHGFSSHDPVTFGVTDSRGQLHICASDANFLQPRHVTFRKGRGPKVTHKYPLGATWWRTSHHRVML